MAKNYYQDALDGLGDIVKNFKWKDEPILHSNTAINKAGKFLLGESDTGFRGTLANLAEGQGFGQAVKGAYTNDGALNYKAIAGSYIGGSLAARAVTGGGIYKDQNGNTNIAGLPFI